MEQKSLTFEEAFAELESVVDKLEGGDLNLEDAMALFERGMFLARYCEKRLDQAELRVSQLITDESGKVAIQPFDPAESSE